MPSAIHFMTKMRRLSTEMLPKLSATALVGIRWAAPQAMRTADPR